jgi:site-specific DNA-methyltransferase (adenine-specific)
MYHLHHTDCFAWLRECPPQSLQAVCTDPPYGLLEFTEKEVSKLRAGRGGVWRLPPMIGGSRRDPLPRFTVLNEVQKKNLARYFHEWGKLLLPALVPGAHVCVAGHPIMQHLVQSALADAGYEVRTAIMRLYFSFRGGDRPKNAEREFPEVCVTPKGAYEPWMLFRKPIAEKTVAQNLRRWKTGGLRRLGLDKPLPDSIPSGRTPDREEAISDHPCLKPQHFMRILVRTLLPLGEGVVLDPFMGSGSTIAAAQAVGYDSIGLELDQAYFSAAEQNIPQLAALYPDFTGDDLMMRASYSAAVADPRQMALAMAEQSTVYGVAPEGHWNKKRHRKSGAPAHQRAENKE